MKKNRLVSVLTVLVLLFGALNMTVSMAVEPGSDQDPLVTLSYLNDTFMNAIMESVDQKIAARNNQIVKELKGEISGTGSGVAETFTVVTLSQGQTLTGGIGCEVMLRVGSATCVTASNPGLIDQTDAVTALFPWNGIVVFIVASGLPGF